MAFYILLWASLVTGSTDTYTALRQRLTADPTEDRWERELSAVLAGQRAFVIDHLGGPASYVEAVIAEAQDPRRAELMLRGALRRIVQAWHADSPEVEDDTEGLLELIAAYTPLEGLEKAVVFLDSTWAATQVSPPPERLLRLRHLCFEAIAQFYRVPPPGGEWQTASFSAYVTRLKTEVEEGADGPHAVARLVELHVWDVKSTSVALFVQTHPDAVAHLLAVVLAPDRTASLRSDAGFLFELCLIVGGEVFEGYGQALRDLGFGQLDLPEGPALVSPDGDQRPLLITDKGLELYMVERHRRLLEGRERSLDELVGSLK